MLDQEKTVLWIAKNYPEIALHIIESSYDAKEKIQFDEITFIDRKELLHYLSGLQYTEDDIIHLVKTKE